MLKALRLSYTATLLLFASACGLLGQPNPSGTLPVPATLPLSSPEASPAASLTTAVEAGAPPLPASPTPLPGGASLSATDTPTPEATSPMWPYQVQTGAPAYLPNLYHGNKDCNWMGVAGQVLGLDGKPVTEFLVVEVTGRIAGLPINQLTAVNMAPEYGEGGFEITLANQPLGSSGALQIRLYDGNLNPLSAPFTFDTHPSCSENLVLIQFTANPAAFPTPTPTLPPTSTPFVPTSFLYLPVIMR